MDDGGHGAGGTRRMMDVSGTSYLAYEIYSDAARTRRWGSTAMSGVSAVAPIDGRVELEVYARIAAGSAPAGAYADTVTVTVEF
jgi:spore coat protein U-like protein